MPLELLAPAMEEARSLTLLGRKPILYAKQENDKNEQGTQSRS